jgi:Kef-type K+ transport system membrane component KefB/voltage-gated potassium channel Kch
MHGLTELLIIFGTASVMIPLLMRLGLSAPIAFLAAGIVLGPHVMGKFATLWPQLRGLDLTTSGSLPVLAEFGVVFLLFVIGLELTITRLKTMRHLVFGLGGAQVLLTLVAIAVAAMLMGANTRSALVIAMALAFSSTAIVVQFLSDANRLGTQAGRASFAILLLQDLAVIPVLMFLGLQTSGTETSIIAEIARALAQAALAGTIIWIAGHFALRPLFKLVASVQSPELFLSAVLFVAIGTGALANAAGMSMSMGAFVAGLLLAETEYRRAIETIIEPFKGLLLGIFFLMTGVAMDISVLLEYPFLIMASVIALVTSKSALIFGLCRLFKLPASAARETALLLGPGGEFAFVILGSATASGLLTKTIAGPIAVVVALSMMLIPTLGRLATRWNTHIRDTKRAGEESQIEVPVQSKPHVIIAGFGRVGKTVATLLQEHKIPYLAIDHLAENVSRERNAGEPIYYGDASSIAFLQKCGLQTASAVAITMDNPARAEEIIRTIHAAKPDIKIIARARDERYAMRMYEAGVTEAVPETIEASLQLGEALLVATGVPMGLAIASIHERRDQSRQLLGRPNRREEVKTLRRK